MLRFGETKITKLYSANKSIKVWDVKTCGYIKTFKFKDGNKDNDLMPFCINEEKLLEKYKAIQTKIKKYYIESFTCL